MARTQKDSVQGGGTAGGLGYEIAGILLLAVSLYIGVSLFSDTGRSNWGGVVGFHLSRVLLTSIGYTSYVFPFLLAGVSVRLLLRRVFTVSPAVPAGFIVFIPASAALISTLAGTKESGGIAGYELSGLLVSYLGTTGALIILFAVVIASVVVATGVSLVYSGLKLLPSVFSLFRAAASVRLRSREDEPEEKTGRPARRKAEPAAEAERPPAKPEVFVPQIHTSRNAPKKEEKKSDEEHLEFTTPEGNFTLPPTSLLDPAPEGGDGVDSKVLLENSKVLERKLLDFGVEGRVLEVRPGPVVTMYEFEPAPGVKVGRITSLSDDLALAMKAMSIRIIAPIPGKSVVGIEVPNRTREPISIRELIECPAFDKSKSRLALALGKDISGVPYIADFARMPHLLIAGATGTGKSVSVNTIITSILFKATPEDVRFLMVDPKMLELSAYEGIPHLITPVITDPKRAAVALRSIVAEMSKRYRLMSDMGAKNIGMYNRMFENLEEGEGAGGRTGARKKAASGEGEGAEELEHRRLPYIVVVIDELADLMMTSGKEVEEALVRLSQMARASGIHLLVATQRPSVDVVTGLIKTNFPARIAFQLPSRTDSRTILDTIGAETLLGEGDMLFLPPNTAKLQRIHGAYVSEREIKKVTDFWKKQGEPTYDEGLLEEPEEELYGDDEEMDEEFLKRYREAVELAETLEMISTSYLQRRFRIGYNTAARLIERMEREGIVGPSQGSRPREVLKRAVQ